MPQKVIPNQIIPENVSYFVNLSLSLQSKHIMMDRPLFKLIALKDAKDFLLSQPEKVQEKILFNIRKVRFGVKDKELFKKLGDTDIWEFRTMWQGMAYRLFSFWDKDGETLVVATHGLVKKTQKTPKGEIEKAEAIRKQWFNNKNGK